MFFIFYSIAIIWITQHTLHISPSRKLYCLLYLPFSIDVTGWGCISTKIGFVGWIHDSLDGLDHKTIIPAFEGVSHRSFCHFGLILIAVQHYISPFFSNTPHDRLESASDFDWFSINLGSLHLIDWFDLSIARRRSVGRKRAKGDNSIGVAIDRIYA